jgi:hypothetical protein
VRAILAPEYELSLSDVALLSTGCCVGVWANEGVHAHAREHGIDLDPL